MRTCLPSKLALVGLRGSGKTTVGRLLAASLGVAFYDLDEAVAKAAGFEHAGLVITELGLPAFRELERAELRSLLGRTQRLVLSTGGGAVEDPLAREALRRDAVTIWLRAPLELLRARVAADERAAGGGAPLRPAIVDPDGAGDEFTVLSERRAPLYREVSRRAVDVDGMTPMQIADRIEAIWT